CSSRSVLPRLERLCGAIPPGLGSGAAAGRSQLSNRCPEKLSNHCSGDPPGGGHTTVPRAGRRRFASPERRGLMFPPKDQDNRRAGARGLTRTHHGALARGLRRAAAGAVCAAAVTLPFAGTAAAQAATTTPAFTPLTLLNGWANYGNGTANAAVVRINGIVHLKGGIKTSGTNPVPFILPAGRPPPHPFSLPLRPWHPH